MNEPIATDSVHKRRHVQAGSMKPTPDFFPTGGGSVFEFAARLDRQFRQGGVDQLAAQLSPGVSLMRQPAAEDAGPQQDRNAGAGGSRQKLATFWVHGSPLGDEKARSEPGPSRFRQQEWYSGEVGVQDSIQRHTAGLAVRVFHPIACCCGQTVYDNRCLFRARIMKLPLVQVDAFASEPFRGAPAR